MPSKKVTDIKDIRALQDECRDRDIPFKDASSAEELRDRLTVKE